MKVAQPSVFFFFCFFLINALNTVNSSETLECSSIRFLSNTITLLITPSSLYHFSTPPSSSSFSHLNSIKSDTHTRTPLPILAHAVVFWQQRIWTPGWAIMTVMRQPCSGIELCWGSMPVASHMNTYVYREEFLLFLLCTLEDQLRCVFIHAAVNGKVVAWCQLF